MNEKLLTRLNTLADGLKKRHNCLGLLALGSCSEQERLDEWSDLDFFVFVEKGYQSHYLSNLEWLEECAPLSFVFRNTKDGHKILWEDGVYAEYAVFELDMMHDIPFSKGKFIFKREGLDLPESSILPMLNPYQTIEYATNEILTNLYVGLLRYHRGERLSAFRLIQVHAIDRILAMSHLIYPTHTENVDMFALERRIELRHPELIEVFNTSLLGYKDIPVSAQILLDYIKTITELNPMMVIEIERLIKLSY
jgi:hypothetical protein